MHRVHEDCLNWSQRLVAHASFIGVCLHLYRIVACSPKLSKTVAGARKLFDLGDVKRSCSRATQGLNRVTKILVDKPKDCSNIVHDALQDVRDGLSKELRSVKTKVNGEI